ncbi:MAG: response regulator transcription factor [Gallionella sp.]|nr:response regulator transcription factor [Gallionella sp.]
MNNLILVSSDKDRLASWNAALNDFIISNLISDKLDTVWDEVARTKPHTLLLDFGLLGLNGSLNVASLRKICAETRTIIMSGDISEELEWELLKAGIRGCCRSDINPKALKQVVLAVQQGELWVRRTLTCRLIDELGKTTSKNKAYRATLGLLNTLTQREYDIAVRVGNGESNKQIAQDCAITERTVKAHLTEIFLKLGISDRLNLALVISADNRNGIANPDYPSSGSPAQTMQLGGSRANDQNT